MNILIEGKKQMKSSIIGRAVIFVAFASLCSTEAYSQIRITEYMYQGPDGEFVELTNIGESAVDMTGWSYDDNSNTPGSFSLSGFGVVAPGESVLITESTEGAFRTAWGLAGGVKILGGSGVVAALGRNDVINIWDNLNTLIDRLQYGDQDFPGSIRTQNLSGWACTQGLGANDPFKWYLSGVADAQGSFTSAGGAIGSPGVFASVGCSSGPTGACCEQGDCTDGLTETDCENGGGTYQGDLTECANVSCPQPSDGVIRITEYMYTGSDGEFVELTNLGASPVDMTGWSYDDNTNLPGSFDLSAFGVVAPGESVIITEADETVFRDAWGLAPGIKIIGESGVVAALGRNDAINIWDASSTLIDRLQYGDQDFAGSIQANNFSGWVCSEGLGANDPHLWILSAIGDLQGSIQSSGGATGSPGAFFSVECANGATIISTIPARKSSVATLASVSVTFSADVVGVVAGNLTVNASAATKVSGSGAGPYDFSGFADPTPGSVSVAVASGGIVTQEGSIPFLGDAWTVAVGTVLVINEIHYHPHDLHDPAQTSEFLEFINAGAVAVDMSNWTISSGVGFTFPVGTMLDPGQYLVVATNPTELEARTGHAGAFQWTSGNLSNSGETVAISDASSNLIDSVTYSDSGEWPTSPDGNGPSLELINPGLPNQYASAWRASSGDYGTPGQQNSVFESEPAPLIVGPMHSPSIPAGNAPVLVTVTVLDNGVSPPVVTLHYRQDAETPGAYASIQMLDDGASGDGAAGDNIYAATMPGLPDGEQYDFYISADDGNAVATLPRHHFSADPSCSTTGCQMDENPGCVLCQTFLCKFADEVVPTDFPVYHILVPRPSKAQQESLVCNISATAFDPCKTEYDATFIDDVGKVFYNVTERYRGQSSILLFPRSYAVDFSSNNPLQTPMGFPVRRLILNGNQPTRQKLGFDIFGDAGLPTSKCEFVRLRFTGINYDTTSIGTNGFNGLYACIERVDNDMLDSQNGAVTPNRGLTSNGNLYRGENTANFDWRGAEPGPYRVNSWGRNGYAKENNESADDFTDLIALCDVMNNSTPEDYATAMAAMVDEDAWSRYFALHNILGNREGGIYRDTGDDYFLFFNPAGHVDGYNAKFITWDTDSILRDPNETIWRTGNTNNNIASVRNFLRHNAFAPIFVKEIHDEINNGLLTIENFNARIDAMPNAAFFAGGGTVNVPRTRQGYKNWFASRVEFINAEIIDSLTLTDLPSSPYTDPNPLIQIGGQLNQAGTHLVTVNDQPATFSVYAGTWSYGYTLLPGRNKIKVKSYDRQGEVTETITGTILYDPPPEAPGLRLTMPNRMVDSKTLTLKAVILDEESNIEWRTCTQVGTVSAVRLSDNSPVPTSVTIFETFPAGAGAGGPAPGTLRFYNGVGSVSLTLDEGADTPPGDILVTVTVGSYSASRIVDVLDGEAPGLYRNLSGTLTGADLIWSPSDGVIHLTGNVILSGSSNTLTIHPDTLIMVDAGPLASGTAILPQSGGRVHATGTHAQPIFFFPTSGAAAMVLPQGMNERNNPFSWRGIYHQNSGSSTYSHVFFTGAGNGEVASHPRPAILRVSGSHSLTVQDCVFADCPGMGMQALNGASGTFLFSRVLMSRMGIGGEWLCNGCTLTIEDSWFTRIGRAPEPNGVDGDVLHLDRPNNTYIVRRSVLTDCGDDLIDHSTGAQPVIEDSLLYDCRDKIVSIGILAEGPEATLTMRNCLIFNGPGGIRCNGAPAFITNCTIGSNTNINGRSCASVINKSILWTNSTNTCCGNVDYTIVGNPDHLGCGTGNLSTNPLFINTSCDYNLQAGSPALTAGPGGSQIGWLGFPYAINGCQNDIDCADGNACTTDECDNGNCHNTPILGCEPCITEAECDDGDGCTLDTCESGQCMHTPIPDCTPCMDAGECDDGIYCNGEETCVDGACQAGTMPCTPETYCDEATDSCVECLDDSHCDDGVACNGIETCVSGECQPGIPLDCDDGNECTLDTCEPEEGCVHTLVCTPTVLAVGPRYLAITPPADQASLALRIESEVLPCTPKYVDENGLLTDTPVFQSSAAWGTVFVADREIIPSIEYSVVADVRQEHEAENLTPAVTATTWSWGNVDNDGVIGLFDLLCVLDGYQDIFTNCSLQSVDLMGQTPNRMVDVFDILAVLDAFQEIAYPDPNPCVQYSTAEDVPTWQPGVFTMQPGAVRIAPGQRVTLHVMITGVDDLRAYELAFRTSGGQRGQLLLEDIQVDTTRPDYIFANQSAHFVANVPQSKMVNALASGSASADTPRYLVTLTLFAGMDVTGSFFVDLDATGSRSVLVDSSGRPIGNWSSQVATVRVRRPVAPVQQSTPVQRH